MSHKTKKILTVIILGVFVLFMILSGVMYFAQPQAPAQPTDETTTSLEITQETGTIATWEM